MYPISVPRRSVSNVVADRGLGAGGVAMDPGRRNALAGPVGTAIGLTLVIAVAVGDPAPANPVLALLLAPAFAVVGAGDVASIEGSKHYHLQQ